MKIYLASDQAGFKLKEVVKKYLVENNFTIEDMGTHSTDRVNWAEYGAKAARKVSEDPENSKGIIVCGSGIGMSIVCNKFKNVRAALCNDEFSAEMSRSCNNANVLNMGTWMIKSKNVLRNLKNCLGVGSWTPDPKTAQRIVKKWLNTEWERSSQQERLDFLNGVEHNNFK